MAAPLRCVPSEDLNLDTSLRFRGPQPPRYVAHLLDGDLAKSNSRRGSNLERDGYHLRITRSLDDGKAYLRSRYAEDPQARFGLLASSRDKDLEAFGLANGFHATKTSRRPLVHRS